MQKQILSTRVEKIRQQNEKNLVDAMAALEKDFEGKRQEAKERLVRKVNWQVCYYNSWNYIQEKDLEAHLIEGGKVSPDKLVEIFEELNHAE